MVRSGQEVWLVAPTQSAADTFAHTLAQRTGGHLAVRRATLPRFVLALSEAERIRRELLPASSLALEATMAKVIAENAGPQGKLGRFREIAEHPGLARALVRTCSDVRLAHVRETHDPSLDAVLALYDEALVAARLADEAALLECARLACSKGALQGAAVALLDVTVRSRAQERLFEELAKGASARFATAPFADTLTVERVERAWKMRPTQIAIADQAEGGVTRITLAQERMFSDDEPAHGAAVPREDDRSVEIFSAPGESRECVEVVRRVIAYAESGVPFDRMAVALRSPEAYGQALVEAMDRADVPAYFARGTRSPDPAGRALLSLLLCAEERLSARRFAEYLSLGEVPQLTEEGAPPAPPPLHARWVPADDEWMPPPPNALEDEAEAAHATSITDIAEAAPVIVSPRLWEKILNVAAVIGTLERWRDRLAGRKRSIELTLASAEREGDARLVDAARRELGAAETLVRFALPLLEDLDRLRTLAAPWSEWLPRLSALATRAVRRPARVLSLLAELAPLGDVRRLTMSEVRALLVLRLTSLTTLPEKRRYGCVYIAPVAALRGGSFSIVFVPGLAERVFPSRVAEDPILLDDARARLSPDLATNEKRSIDERLCLQVALGAASERVVVSYPRVDLDTGRVRTPSSYMLDLVKAAHGRVMGFEELSRLAGDRGRARIGWPAPEARIDAIDDAEHDLALLRAVLEKPEAEATGEARYLLASNEHLARALRARARRWLKAFGKSDGLVDPSPEAKALLAAHQLSVRSFSPTALQNYAACPYRFFLYAVHKLAPREEPEAIEEIGPLDRGSLVHEMSFTFLSRMRDEGKLPLDPNDLDEARRVLDDTLDKVAAQYKETLFPAIERVWEDTVQSIRADAREWLRLLAEQRDFTPAYFELSFGLKNEGERDEHSKNEWVTIDAGINLRGSIDLVERSADGTLRATDYKTGKQRATQGRTIIGGGQTLQPVLYALVLEKLFPGARVHSGRLHYSTSTGGFEAVDIELDDRARAAAQKLAHTVDGALKEGMLPAYPEPKGCTWCDYKTVCGPYEEIRAKRKARAKMEPLIVLRREA